MCLSTRWKCDTSPETYSFHDTPCPQMGQDNCVKHSVDNKAQSESVSETHSL